jgi:hypothetical protein
MWKRGALVFAAVITATASGALAAEKKAGQDPKRLFPKVVLVVDCTRRKDVKAARDFVAYMTRKLPDKPAVGVYQYVIYRDTQFVAAATLPSARKTAEREKAAAIVHVKIIKREPTGWGMQASCSVLLPTVSKTSRRVSWKTKRAAVLSLRQQGGIPRVVVEDEPNTKGDPTDFMQMRQDIKRLTYNAAVEVDLRRMPRAPKKGERIKATVTNNTPLGIFRFEAAITSRGKSCSWSYSGDALPPGESEATLQAYPWSGKFVSPLNPPPPSGSSRITYVHYTAAAEADK